MTALIVIPLLLLAGLFGLIAAIGLRLALRLPQIAKHGWEAGLE